MTSDKKIDKDLLENFIHYAMEVEVYSRDTSLIKKLIETGWPEFQLESPDRAKEIREYWRVSGWLANKLRGSGEVVIKNRFGCWWGRTCTGQRVHEDRIISQIMEEWLHSSGKR